MKLNLVWFKSKSKLLSSKYWLWIKSMRQVVAMIIDYCCWKILPQLAIFHLDYFDNLFQLLTQTSIILIILILIMLIPFYRIQVSLVRSMGPSVSKYDMFVKLNWCDSGWWRYQLLVKLIYMIMPTGQSIGNVAMPVVPPGGQIWNQC